MSDNHEPSESQAGCIEALCGKPESESTGESFIHVIDFYPAENGGSARVSSTIKFSTFYTQFKRDPAQTSVPERSGGMCRWIHIPVNDTSIAQQCVERLLGKDEVDHARNTWTQKLRPAISDSPIKVPSHAWSMEPSVQVYPVHRKVCHDQRPQPKCRTGFALFLPYLNWDRFEKIEVKASHGPSKIGRPSVRHQRRTLDEFYHSGLHDTKLRNAGQTVSKWTGNSEAVPENGRARAVGDSLVVMADQLWIWVLDKYTIMSCFPTDEPLCENGSSDMHDLDIMASAITFENLGKCEDVVDLLALLTHQSINQIFEESNCGFVDILSIYRWAAANKGARHMELLEAFYEREPGYSKDRRWREELNLILEVVDILDELNILMLLLEKQLDVVRDLRSKCSLAENPKMLKNHDREHECSRRNDLGYAGDLLGQALDRLQAKIAETKRLHGEVTHTHKLVVELFDLEQKAASLNEARMAGELGLMAAQQARVTTKQGQAVMLFTIVTIIFNVAEFTGDDKNPKASEVWKIGAPVSVVVIVVALTIAFFIMFSWKRSKVARAVRAFLRRHRQRSGPQTDIPLSGS